MVGTNQSPVPTILRLHVTFSKHDTVARDKILNLTWTQQLSMSSSNQTYADASIGSNWGSFLLDNLMSPSIIFEVYTTPSKNYGFFDAEVFNIGNAWSNASQTFTAPVSGIYYFSYSFGVPATTKVWNYPSLSGSYYCDVEMYDVIHAGLDIISRGCLMNLTAGHTVGIAYKYSAGDSSYSESSFRGFLYSPAHGVKVAWSVHNSGYVSGNGSAMSFPVTLVNLPTTVWRSSSNTVTIPVNGTYYVELVGKTAGTPSDGIDMRLTLNNSTVLSRLYFNSLYNYISRSQPIIVYLQANSVLTVAYYAVDLAGSNYNGLSFQGFLIYP